MTQDANVCPVNCKTCHYYDKGLCLMANAAEDCERVKKEEEED